MIKNLSTKVPGHMFYNVDYVNVEVFPFPEVWKIGRICPVHKSNDIAIDL